MSVTQLGYLGIGVSDVDAWEIYASDVLGLQVAGKEADGSLRLRMDQHFYRFMIHPRGEDDLLYAGWEVKDEAALMDIAERVRAVGISVEQGSPADLEARRVVGLIKFKRIRRIWLRRYSTVLTWTRYAPSTRHGRSRASRLAKTAAWAWATSSFPCLTWKRASTSIAMSWG